MTIGIDGEMLARFYELSAMKKEMDQELKELKEHFNLYFDEKVGVNRKAEFAANGYKLQRQIRKSERFNDEQAVERLQELQLEDLIETVSRPDKDRINAAMELGLLRDDQIEDLLVRNYSKVYVVRKTK